MAVQQLTAPSWAKNRLFHVFVFIEKMRGTHYSFSRSVWVVLGKEKHIEVVPRIQGMCYDMPSPTCLLLCFKAVAE